jgi:hypothetical protein
MSIDGGAGARSEDQGDVVEEGARNADGEAPADDATQRRVPTGPHHHRHASLLSVALVGALGEWRHCGGIVKRDGASVMA